MDTLHAVLRSLKSERGPHSDRRPDHLTVFREFLAELDRLGRRKTRAAPARLKGKSRKT